MKYNKPNYSRRGELVWGIKSCDKIRRSEKKPCEALGEGNAKLLHDGPRRSLLFNYNYLRKPYPTFLMFRLRRSAQVPIFHLVFHRAYATTYRLLRDFRPNNIYTKPWMKKAIMKNSFREEGNARMSPAKVETLKEQMGLAATLSDTFEGESESVGTYLPILFP